MGKIDWEEAKQEFILSRKISLREFAELKGLNYNGYFSRKTKGWIKEKEERLCKIRKEVLQRVDEKKIDKEVSAEKRFSKIINNLHEKIEDKLNDDSLFEGAKGIEMIDSLLKSTERLYKIHRTVGTYSSSKNQGCMTEMFEALRLSANKYYAAPISEE